MRGYRFTVLCKMPHDLRGEYSEEIDVITARRSTTAAIQAAQMIIDADYNSELRPMRVIRGMEIQISSIS